MTSMNVAEAKAKLSELVARARAGEEVIIARDGVPMVMLVPVKDPRTQRAFGRDRGRFVIPPSFDEADEEIARALEKSTLFPPRPRSVSKRRTARPRRQSPARTRR
jgi:prevent-host-death family protein